MKTRLLIFVIVIASCFFKTATAQTVTSVAGLDFGTEYNKAKSYLTNHFGFNNYERTGDYLLTFRDVMVGGFAYETAEFYFKNSNFVAVRLYSAFPLSKLNDAKSFRDRIIARYKDKYWHNEPYTSDGFQCYAFGSSPNYYAYYPIYVKLFKATENNSGKMMYVVECDYYIHSITENNDDI